MSFLFDLDYQIDIRYKIAINKFAITMKKQSPKSSTELATSDITIISSVYFKLCDLHVIDAYHPNDSYFTIREVPPLWQLIGFA